MNTGEYLDAVRQALNLPSDYALQKPLELSKSQLSKYRTGRESLSDATALRVAEILGIAPAKVLVDMHIQKSKSPELRAAWSAAMEKISASFKTLLSPWDGHERRAFVRG
jgi:transcriptional regulator with XRE-family HTH domain